MHPRFGIERERNKSLFFKKYNNDRCLFHFHSQIELYFVDEGEMDMLVGGSQRTLKAGELSVALSYCAHAYKTPVASKSSVFIIPTELCEEFVKATKNKRLAFPFITDKAIVSRIKEYIELSQKCGISKLTQLGYIHLILGLILETSPLAEGGEPIDNELSSKILFYIDENCKNAITSGDISKHFGYSQSYISRYFKSCFGITLSEYIMAVRLKKAAAIMLTGKHSITYAALESGFGSIRTFYRAFQNEFACTPKEYLEKNTAK